MKAKKLLKKAQFHGLNKLYDVKFRWIWITALLLLLAAAINIAGTIVLRFLEAPTYIVRKEKVRNYMEFPSVQLCPEVSFPEYKIEEFFSQLTFPDNVNIPYIRGIIQQLGAFYSPDVNYNVHDVKMIQGLLEYNKLDVYIAAKMLTVSCEEFLMNTFPDNVNIPYIRGIIQQLGAFYSPDVNYNVHDVKMIQGLLEYNKLVQFSCRLFGQMKNCAELFKLEISQYGYCCIFNSRSLRSEILEYGVHKVRPKVEYVTPFVGFGAGLVVAVNQSMQPANVDLDYKWMSVDGGQAYVDAALNGTPVSPGTEMWFGHYNQGFHIDEDAVNLIPELRGCRMLNERLNFFPIYHKKYCQMECEISHLLQNCKCVLVPHPVTPDVPICSARYLPCAKRALTNLNKGACPCPHTCDADTDHVEISSFRLFKNNAFIDPFYADLDSSKTSVVRVFIAHRNVKTKLRRSYYSYQDLFGQLGGIFNVFFGCSLLSILEMLQIIKYAFTGCRERRKKQSKYLKTNKQDGNKTKIRKLPSKM